MKLQAYYEGDAAPVVVSVDADASAVESAIQSMDWTRLAFLTLAIDDANYLECSGSTNPAEGLCLILMHEGVEFVSENAPASPLDSLSTFHAFLNNATDDVFRVILDADARGLSTEDIGEIVNEEAASQKQRRMREALAAASRLFADQKFKEFAESLSPFEDELGALDRKKLSIARKKAT